MRLKHAAIGAVVVLAVTPVARAQGVGGPVSRGDASVTLGWLNVDKTGVVGSRGSNDWYRSLYGGAGLGWYWTDHWKTEIDGGVSSSADLRVYSLAVIDGRNTSLSSTYSFVTRQITIGQQYQFQRNAWVHPFAGVGIDLTWEQTNRSDEIYSAQPVRSTTHPRQTEWIARPFVMFGLKAYVAPQAFLRTDLKIAFDKGIDEALLRFGLGVDF